MSRHRLEVRLPAASEAAIDVRRWRARRGRTPEGVLTETAASARMLALVAEDHAEQRELEHDAAERRRRGITFRELASEWLVYIEREKGAEPSTLRDYRWLLAEPGAAHRRGWGLPGLLMAALGDRAACRLGYLTLPDGAAELVFQVLSELHERGSLIVLELSRFLSPSVVADHRNAPVNALGYLRVMFALNDLDETLDRLLKHGAELVSTDVVQYEDMYRLCYIRGPEGLLIGLAEQLS